jgi:hypothetical protein
VGIEQGALVGVFDLANDLRHPIRPEKGRAFEALDGAHLLGHLGPLVQQAQQLLVNGVDLVAQRAQASVFGGGWVWGGVVTHAQAWVFSNSRM